MKKAVFIAAVLGLLIIINSLVRSIYDLLQKQELLTSAEIKLEEEKLKNQKLKASLSYVETEEFKEEAARNSLFLVKPGEQEVVVPQKIEIEEVKETELPNWQQWFKLFF